jgi:HemY protein
MLRILAFLLVVLALALGFGWLQDHPGEVALTWPGVLPAGGDNISLGVTTFIVIELVVIALVCVVLWLLSGFVKAPKRLGRFFGTRRRDKGYSALSAGIVAAGAGDAVLARRMTKRSEKFLSNRREPLVRFLDAQTAMIEGDHDRARSAFETMEKEPETRLLALRGLFLEAERLGDDAAARGYAERAVRIAPHVPWAGGAVLEAKSIEGDFEGALAILEAQKNARLIERQESIRLRAVLLTAQAMAIADRDPAGSKLAALEAQKLAPSLTPAATTAAQALFRLGDVKRGSKVLEKAWTEEPHPDVAAAYVQARPGDSVADRLKRAKTLQQLRPNHVESSLVVAHAALDARDFTLAREEAMAASRMAPRESVFLLLADIEEAETGAEGRVREWLGKAIRAPRDPAWTADGYVSENWAPVSPVTGRLDAFRWKVPAQRIDQDGTVIEAPVEPVGIETSPEPAVPAASMLADRANPPSPDATIVETVDEPTPSAQPTAVSETPASLAAGSAQGESRFKLF